MKELYPRNWAIQRFIVKLVHSWSVKKETFKMLWLVF